MASPNRTHSQTVAWLRELEAHPYNADFFEVLRRFENIYADKPRIGGSVRAAEDPIRLKQTPSLAFAPSAISFFRPGDQDHKDELSCYFFGLFGPNGPLPQHLTEYARERQRNHRDPAFSEFANLFNHRMLCLLYRAWSSSQPALGMDRPDANPYDLYLGALIGIGTPELRHRSALPDYAALYRAGIFSLKTRPAAGLRSLLADYFQLPVKIREFVGNRLAIGENNHLRLGSNPNKGILGRDSLLGSTIWDCQSKFQVVCGPLDLPTYKSLLPNGQAIERLVAMVRLYLGDELEWDLILLLHPEQLPSTCLGKGQQLGWTSWLGTWQNQNTPPSGRFNPRQQATGNPNE
ncbi:MAG: type VI secretion system baseplate subunit TssG [Motiliproteus sp.]